MHRQHVRQVKLLQLRRDLSQIIVRRRRQVEAAKERVDLLDSADFLGVLKGVYDAGMSARANHHQPAIAEAEAGNVLMPMLVGLRPAGQFLGGEMVVHIGVGIAAKTVLDAEFDPAIRQYVLDAGARYRPGRKGVALDQRRGVRQYRLDIQRLQPAAVERDRSGEAAIRGPADSLAEDVLTTSIEA